MICQKCNSTRIASIYGKCNDLCVININQIEYDGYVPHDMNIGGGDDISVDLCLDCGHVQGMWPLPVSKIEKASNKKNDLIESWQPNSKYHTYLTELMYWVTSNPNVGTMKTFPILMGTDDDPDRIIAGIISLKINPATELIADCLIEVLSDWEYITLLKSEINKFWPDEDNY